MPWRIALDHARGTHATHTAFESLWEQAVRRSSHHYGCHVAALQYLSAQWYGSHRECFDFAEQAAADALPGSLVQALPVRAAFAQLLSGETNSVQDDRIDAAADLAITLSGDYAAGDPWPAEVRNLLTYVLVGRGRWADALEQFRLIGPYATSFPWTSVDRRSAGPVPRGEGRCTDPDRLGDSRCAARAGRRRRTRPLRRPLGLTVVTTAVSPSSR